MRLKLAQPLALTFLIACAGSGASFAAEQTVPTPAAAETTIEDTTPSTTYGGGCPFSGQEEASTEEVVS